MANGNGGDAWHEAQPCSIASPPSPLCKLDAPQEVHTMDTCRFGRKLKIASTFSIKHQLRKLMIEDEIRQLEKQLSDTAQGSKTHLAIKSGEPK
jgi:hypothetical protein